MTIEAQKQSIQLNQSLKKRHLNLLLLALELYGPELVAKLNSPSDFATQFQGFHQPTSGDESSVLVSSKNCDLMVTFYRDFFSKALIMP